MYPKGVEEELLRYMYKRHVERFGTTRHNLPESNLSLLAGRELEDEIPRILTINGNMKKYFVVDAAKELERRGLVQFNHDNAYFWLTQDGFSQASKGFVRRSLDFFNVNAGLATLIALLSLVVSIIALAVSAQ